ncbi:MAG: HD-GYP domain-containing protein [Thiovulaceae bacterium]|nr:HD-GYP domain-containing protein [Sulfurimonadaceae bacterium]
MKQKVIRQSKINAIIDNTQNEKEEKKQAYILIDKDMMNLIPVDKRILNLGSKIDFKLFATDEKTHMSLFLQADTVIEKDEKYKLQYVEKVFALESEKDKYDNFLEHHLQNILKDDLLSLDEKTDVIYAASTDLTKNLYNNPDSLKNANLSENIVKPMLATIIHNENTISSYLKIIEYDYYTHTHSLNVSVYSLCLGNELNLDEDTLTSLGRAALLHDIGKSKIDPKIVNKQGSLTEEEFEMMKNHPTYGYEIAKEYNIKDQNIIDGIYKHHEKLDGNGYPNKLSSNEIGLFPRIISICDVFDALTTRRSYKPAMKSFEALSLMKTTMSSHLDFSLLSTFIKMLHHK